MKNKFSPKTAPLLFLTTAAMLVLFSTQATTFANSATWDVTPASGFWNNNSNWSAAFPDGSSDVATFDVSNTTAVEIPVPITLAEITFNSGASAFTITVDSDLDFFGTGITNNSGITQNFTVVSGLPSPGRILFFNSATAGSMTSFTNNGGTVSGADGGIMGFTNSSTADSSTITNNGATVSGANGGLTQFIGTSTAGSATLIANGGSGGGNGGSIQFFQTSTGGTPTVKVFGNGNLDISGHLGGVGIGSLEGSGNVFLGANNLSVGSNNSTPLNPFSGVMSGTGGSLTKTGTGTFTITGANTYTGGTTVAGGSLFVNTPKNFTDSGTGTGSVTVSSGTLGGSGSIGGGVIGNGAVTVNSGATLAPGATGNGSTGILNTGDLTLASGSNFSVDLEGPVAGTDYDQVFVTGAVSISMANLALNLVSGLSVGDNLFIVESTGAVTGTFAGLPDGATFTQDGVTFTIDYAPSGVGALNYIELSVDRVTAVPEPSSYIGGLLGIVGLCWYQRRRFMRLLSSRSA